MQHAGKLGKALAGMSQVLGEVPLTIKIRTGVQTGQPVAHKMIPKFQKDWGLSAMTVRRRPKEQDRGRRELTWSRRLDSRPFTTAALQQESRLRM